MQVEAVRLFVERARATHPHFMLTAHNAPLVAQICRRLDGIPLALELAAARLRGLAVEELVARLDQRFLLLTGGGRMAPPRQQTLQATVDWSYSLLSEPEQAFFSRLAVFLGGFTLEAAEAVCTGEPVPAEAVLDLVLRLVDKSLVAVEGERAGRTRYRLLETLRQYGQERLVARGERSGIAAALRDLGWLARCEGATGHARAHYEEALALERDLGDVARIAATLAGLGDVARAERKHAQAAVHYAEGPAVLRESEARNERTACLEGLAAVAWADGDAERAARLCGAAAAARVPDLQITPVTMTGAAAIIAATRAALGVASFELAWAAGHSMTQLEVIAEARTDGASYGYSGGAAPYRSTRSRRSETAPRR